MATILGLQVLASFFIALIFNAVSRSFISGWIGGALAMALFPVIKAMLQ